VQLALARYQPDSLPDLRLSPAVRTDLVQLMPDRTLLIDKQAAQIRVSLTGVTPDPPNRVEVTLEQGTLRLTLVRRRVDLGGGCQPVESVWFR
jgi:hypothetical protein